MQYVAFLRAINVGRHNRIKMADLRDRCAALGLKNVATYVQTGNIAFESDDGVGQLTLALEAMLIAMDCRNADAIVLTRDELLDILALKPFEAHDPEQYRLYVTLLRDPLPPAAAAQLAISATGVIAAHDRAVFSVIEIGAASPPDLNGALQKAVKIPATTRYWHILQAVADLGAPA
jgi:uncharacterized protein (DUF1697 family)